MMRLTRAISLNMLVLRESVKTVLAQEADIRMQEEHSVQQAYIRKQEAHNVSTADEAYVDNLLTQASTVHHNDGLGKRWTADDTSTGKGKFRFTPPRDQPATSHSRPARRFEVAGRVRKEPSHAPDWRRTPRAKPNSEWRSTDTHFASCKEPKRVPLCRKKMTGLQERRRQHHNAMPPTLRVVIGSPSSQTLSLRPQMKRIPQFEKAPVLMQTLDTTGLVSLQTIGSYFTKSLPPLDKPSGEPATRTRNVNNYRKRRNKKNRRRGRKGQKKLFSFGSVSRSC